MIIAFVDDNKTDQDHTLKLFIEAFKTMNIPIVKIDRFSSGEEFLENWEKRHYDLIILDILMNNMSGIAVAKEIRRFNKDVRIVFCSNSNEFAHESYLLNASYYIKKPATFEEINKMITRLQIKDFESRRFIVLSDNQSVVLRDILYAECLGHTMYIYMKSGKTLTHQSSFKKFMEYLRPYDFFCECNRGMVINMHEVISQQKDTFLLTGDVPIFISRRKQKEAVIQYQHFLFQLLRDDIN